MDSLDYWRLCDELSVIDAALLIVELDPSQEAGYVETLAMHNRPPGYEAAKKALQNAILSGKLKATIRRDAWERGWDEVGGDGERFEAGAGLTIFPDLTQAAVPELSGGQPWLGVKKRGIMYRAEPSWSLTTVLVEDLRKWLFGRGLQTGFFFPKASDAPDYFDRENPRYAPKLAAAVRAWQAVTNPKGRHPKQALMKWLREHAAEFDLSDDEGKPNDTGIEEVAKVANWQPLGGAPKTPRA